MHKTLEKVVRKSSRKVKLNKSLKSVFFFKFDKNASEDLKIVKGKTKKQKLWSWLFLGLNVLIVAGILIYQFVFNETKPLGELFAEKPYWRYLFMALGCLAIFYIAEGLSYAIMYKKFTGKFKFGLGLKLSVVGKYWDSLTPFGSGGQFAQIAYSNGKKNSGYVSTSVVVGKFMLWQIAFILIGIVTICLPLPVEFYADQNIGGNVIKYLALVGVLLNVVMFAFVWSVSISKKMCRFFVIGGLKLLTKMHIVKDYPKALFRSMKFIRNYQKSIKAFSKSPLLVISEILLDAVGLIVMSVVAFCIYEMFNYPNGTVGLVEIVTMSFLCTFATTFFPIPGGSGAAEVSFVAMFSRFFENGEQFWALLLWRFFTYYLYIIFGFLLTLIEPLCIRFFGRIKSKRSAKKQNIGAD